MYIHNTVHVFWPERTCLPAPYVLRCRPAGVRGQAGEQHRGKYSPFHPQGHRSAPSQRGLQPSAEYEAPISPLQQREAAPVSHLRSQ